MNPIAEGSPPTPGEFGLIRWLRDHAPGHERVIQGIGDDCAILGTTPAHGVQVVTTDLLMDGRHFRLDRDGAVAVGYKAMGVNLSDVAAMAARPVAAFVGVALPRDRAAAIAVDLFRGLDEAARSYGVALAGGDTNAWDGPLVVAVTLIGEAFPPAPIRRSGARPGDAIVVTGPLGGSILGRHLRPRPRIAEAAAIVAAVPVHAMIDLSDGLASDLRHVLAESGGLGALLVEESIPIHDDARALSAIAGRPAVEHALTDGEDFELCLTLDPESAARLLRDPPNGTTPALVGTITGEPGLRWRRRDGRVVPLDLAGFDHLAG